MAYHNSQQQQNNNSPYGSNHVYNPLTPPLTTQTNSQQQQLAIHANNNNIEMIPSQPSSLVSFGSSSSIGSTSPEVKTEDKLFDKIEDMLCEYMREPTQHYLHCRVLRWSTDDELSQQFSAVIIINPPNTTKH